MSDEDMMQEVFLPVYHLVTEVIQDQITKAKPNQEGKLLYIRIFSPYFQPRLNTKL